MAIVSRFLVSLVLGTAVLNGALPVSAQDAGAPAVVERREIEIPDSRILSLSPDGLLVAATSFSQDRLCVYVRETLAEQACADLEPLEAGLMMEDVVWSPDSSKLALAERGFILFRDGDLWMMDALSGALTNLTDDGVNAGIPFGDDEVEFSELFLDNAPAWLPDSSGVTFSRSTWRDGVWMGNTIETVRLDGGSPEELARVSPDLPGMVTLPMRWSPDGQHLYYTVFSPDRDDERNGLWRLDADGTTTQIVPADPELGPAAVQTVSPDGSLALVFYVVAAGVMKTDAPLYALLETATGVVTPVEMTAPDQPEFTFLSPVALSPDGTLLVSVTRLTDPEFQLIARSTETGAETVLVPEGLPRAYAMSRYGPVSWALDGTILLNSDLGVATLLTLSEGVDIPDVAPEPTADAESTPVPPDDESDTTVVTNDNDVPVRSSPGTSGQTVATLSAGTPLIVLGAPVEADGFDWVPVLDPATNTLGWVRVEFIDTVE